jgi:hypothetical protein
MEITTDVALRGIAWDIAIDALSPLFKPRAQYSIYMLSLSIGIMYDRRIESNEDYRHSVPRNVLQNNDNGKLDFMFQAAILSTTTESFTEDERLELAFGEKTDFKKIDFLTQFANFGVTKLVEHIGASPIESMENIKNFLAATVEGNNFDIDALPDDLLTEET